MRRTLSVQMFNVHVVPVRSDNYAYILAETSSKQCVVIDPYDADKMLSTVKSHGLSCQAVLTTHKHHDHAGGNAAFVAALPVPVYGGDEETARRRAALAPRQHTRAREESGCCGMACGISRKRDCVSAANRDPASVANKDLVSGANAGRRCPGNVTGGHSSISRTGEF